MPGKRRGRPRGPCSERELAQRRAAPTKTGEHAAGLAKGARPCKAGFCPKGFEYPCQTRELMIEHGHGTPPYCVVTNPQPHQLQAALEAHLKARGGNFDSLERLTDLRRAYLTVAVEKELGALCVEGSAIPIYAVDDQGDLAVDDEGLPRLQKMIANPRAPMIIEMMKLLGDTGSEQLLTPKSQGREPALDDDDVLDEIRQGEAVFIKLQAKAKASSSRKKASRSRAQPKSRTKEKVTKKSEGSR